MNTLHNIHRRLSTMLKFYYEAREKAFNSDYPWQEQVLGALLCVGIWVVLTGVVYLIWRFA